MTEATDTLKRMLDLSQMTLTAARLLPVRLSIDNNPPPSWGKIRQYWQSEITEFPEDITELRQYALFEFFHQGLQSLEAITLLAPMPYQVRSAIVLGRLIMELRINAAWLSDPQVPAHQQDKRILSWLEWQRFFAMRCESRPRKESDIDNHLQWSKALKKDEKRRLKEKYGKENCFHCGMKQRAEMVGKGSLREYEIIYRDYSLATHGELPDSLQPMKPEIVLFLAVHEQYFLAEFLAGAFEKIELFRKFWDPISKKMREESDFLKETSQRTS